MVSRIIKLDSSEPVKWPLFPHRFRSRIFGFGRNVTKIFLVFQLGDINLMLMFGLDALPWGEIEVQEPKCG